MCPFLGHRPVFSAIWNLGILESWNLGIFAGKSAVVGLTHVAKMLIYATLAEVIDHISMCIEVTGLADAR